MIYIKVAGQEYPASINGRVADRSWDGRDTAEITLTMTVDAAKALLPDGTAWSIVQRDMVDAVDSDGNLTGEQTEQVQEFDNSAYSLSGAITDHRDGTVTIKMGKPLDAERMAAALERLGVTVYA